MYWNKREEAVKTNPDGMFYVFEKEDVTNSDLSAVQDVAWYDNEKEARDDIYKSWKALTREEKKKYSYNLITEFYSNGELEDSTKSFGFGSTRKKEIIHDTTINLRGNDPWYIIREIMGSNCIKTDSDAGALKVGMGNATMLIPNGYGDGTTRSAIVKTAYRSDDWKMVQNIMRFFTTIEGKLDIYDYDCGNDVIDTIEGKFEVYCYEGLIVFLEEEK